MVKVYKMITLFYKMNCQKAVVAYHHISSKQFNDVCKGTTSNPRFVVVRGDLCPAVVGFNYDRVIYELVSYPCLSTL